MTAQARAAVRAGADGEVHVGLCRRAASVGVDDDEWHAALSRPCDVAHEVDVGGDRVGAPDGDEVAVVASSSAGTPQRLP